MAGWDDVRRAALNMPEAIEGESRGLRGWSVRKKGFVWERPLRKADVAALGAEAPDGDILGGRVETARGRLAGRALTGLAPRRARGETDRTSPYGAVVDSVKVSVLL